MARLRLALSGLGKMGRAVLEAASARPEEFQVVATIDANNPNLPLVPYFVPRQLQEALHGCDIVIDFSSPAFSVQVVEAAAAQGKNFLVGTTGFTQEQLSKIEFAAKRSGVSGMVAPNFSLGVGAFLEILRLASRLLPNYEVEILETHHDQKKDAPSGTAAKAADVILHERQLSKDKLVVGRNGASPRQPGEIGIHSIRAGQVVGEHEVLFAGNNEVVKLSHSALSRRCFADGCLASAVWLHGKRDGRIYSIKDVMGV